MKELSAAAQSCWAQASSPAAQRTAGSSQVTLPLSERVADSVRARGAQITPPCRKQPGHHEPNRPRQEFEPRHQGQALTGRFQSLALSHQTSHFLQAADRAGAVPLVCQTRGLDPHLVQSRLVGAHPWIALARDLDRRLERGAGAVEAAAPAVRDAKTVVGQHGLKLRRVLVAQAHAQESCLDRVVAAAEQHADMRQGGERLGLAVDIADFLEQLRRAPARVARAPQARSDAVAMRQARPRMSLDVAV